MFGAHDQSFVVPFVVPRRGHLLKLLRYRYSTSCKAYSAEFLLRCAYSSANFECGNDLSLGFQFQVHHQSQVMSADFCLFRIDITYGWLNYQIEHHMFPDMTPLQYRKFQPLVKSICQKHKVTTVANSVVMLTDLF